MIFVYNSFDWRFVCLFISLSFSLSQCVCVYASHMFVFKLSRAQIITHKLNRFTDALTRRDCAHGQTHIGRVSSASPLLPFSPSHSLSLFLLLPQWNSLYDYRMLDFHTIAVTECVNWEKRVNKWLIFLLLYFYFTFPPSRLVIRTTNFWLTRYCVMSTNLWTRYIWKRRGR